MSRAAVAAALLTPALLAPMAVAAQDVPDPVYAAQGSLEVPGTVDPFMRPDRPELAALGVRLGGFTLRPSVELSAIANSNVRLLPTDQGADVGIILQPTVTLASDSGRYRLRAFATGSAVRYASKSTENVEQLFGGLSFDRPLGATSSVRVNVEGGRFVEDRAALFTPRNIRSPAEFDRLYGQVSGVVAPGRFVIAPSFEVDRLAYRDVRLEDAPRVTVDQSERSFARYNPALVVGYTVSADTTVFAGAEANRRDFDAARRGVDRDSSGWVLFAGARFRPTPLTRLEVAAGYLKQTYREPLKGPSAAYFRADFVWVPTGLTTVRFDVRRDVSETGAVLAGGATRTRVGGGVMHELLRNLILSASAEYTRFDFSTLDRVDDRIAANVEARYVANRKFDVFARADQVFVSTGDPIAFDPEFSRTRVVAGVAWKL